MNLIWRCRWPEVEATLSKIHPLVNAQLFMNSTRDVSVINYDNERNNQVPFPFAFPRTANQGRAMRGRARDGVARLGKQAFQQGEANVNWTEEVQHGSEERC
jgi:hypothetical protein